MKNIIYAKDVAVKPKIYIKIRKTDEWNFISLCGVMLVIHMENISSSKQTYKKNKRIIIKVMVIDMCVMLCFKI